MAEESKKMMISLKTADGNVFEVEPAIAKEMQTVQSFIDADGAAAAAVIPLPNVFGRELARIIEYLRQHRLFGGAGGGAEAKDFDAEFVKGLSDDEAKELLIAANYLNIKDLLEFLCQTIADRIKNKSVEFARKFFGIVNDYTPEEEARLRQENAWAFEGVDEDED